MFFTPGQVDHRGDPQPDENQQHREQLVVTLVDEVLDVQHPADRDGRVARPRGDPVRPSVREPEAVAEGDPRVRVRAAVSGQSPRQRGEQQREREGANGGTIAAIKPNWCGPWAPWCCSLVGPGIPPETSIFRPGSTLVGLR
jgi:hypothetical protein